MGWLHSELFKKLQYWKLYSFLFLSSVYWFFVINIKHLPTSHVALLPSVVTTVSKYPMALIWLLDTELILMFKFCVASFRSVLREDINKLHRQLLDERSKTEKLKQDFVCPKVICSILTQYLRLCTYVFSLEVMCYGLKINSLLLFLLRM